MGSLIEAVLVALLVGIFTLLGVWLAGWQERKRAREAKETRKEEMLYEKQLEALEEAIEFLTFMYRGWHGVITAYEEWAEPLEEERSLIDDKIASVIDILEDEGSVEIMARVSTYLPLDTKDVLRKYNTQAVTSVEKMKKCLLRGEGVDIALAKEQLTVAYKATVLKMREHLGIKESVGVGEATRIGGRRRLKLKFWASGRPTSRPKS